MDPMKPSARPPGSIHVDPLVAPLPRAVPPASPPTPPLAQPTGILVDPPRPRTNDERIVEAIERIDQTLARWHRRRTGVVSIMVGVFMALIAFFLVFTIVVELRASKNMPITDRVSE